MTAGAPIDEILEAQYNNQRRVPEHPAILEDWARRSAGVRTHRRCSPDLAYGEAARERIDLYHADEPAAPLLVYVHGGYWQRGDKSVYGFVAEGPLALGMSVAVVNYGLCPQAEFQGIAPQVARALAWLAQQAPDLGLDPARVFLCGHSAGGHLTAAMLATDFSRLDARLAPCPLRGAIAVSGVFELAPLIPTSINEALGLDEALAARESPIAMSPVPGACPLVAAVGGEESDEFRRQSRALVERWSPAVATRYVELARRNHFTVLEELADPGGGLCAALRELLGRQP